MVRQHYLPRLEVTTGKIIATHSKRRRRVEFLDFMNSVNAAFPDRKLHVILDNLNTHTKNAHWLEAHPNVQFHFTPTSASAPHTPRKSRSPKKLWRSFWPIP
jgi:hypothetical protein